MLAFLSVLNSQKHFGTFLYLCLDETDEVVMVTSQLSATMLGLQKFSNYSVEVLAFTQMGSGVRSKPIYVMTQQDGELLNDQKTADLIEFMIGHLYIK